MAGSKTLAWLKSLNEKEKRDFLKIVEGKRAGKLSKLLACLEKLPAGAKKPSNAELFVTVFGEEYAAEKDYLLRNELRHLNNALKDFIAGNISTQGATEDVAQELLLLSEFVERGEAANFERAFKQLIRKAEDLDDVLTLAAAWRLQTRLLSLRPPLHEPEMQQALALIAQSQNWQQRALLRHQLAEWVHECRFRRMIAATQHLGVELTEPPLAGRAMEELGPVDRYLLAKGKTYGLESASRLSALHELEQLLDEITDPVLPKAEEQIWLLASLALESYLNRNFEQAIATFEKLEGVDGVAQYPQWPSICFNHIGALLKLRNYGAALRTMKEHGKSIEAVTGMADRFRCQKAMNLVFNGHYDQALEVLKKHVRHTNTDSYIYYRLVNTIAFYKRGNLLAALQEVENLLQATQLRKAKTPINNRMAKLLERFLRAVADLPKQKAVLQIQMLKSEIEELDASSRDVLVMQWLQEALEKV